MTETCSHQYTLPTDDPQLIIETCGRACPGYELKIWRSDDPDVEARDRRDRPDRRARRQPDARLFRRPGGDRGRVQRAGLVHDRRSRLDRRARLSAHHRAQEGRDHPRRPQHLSGAHRGPGDAPSGGRARRRGSGRRRAARREGLPRRDVARGRAASSAAEMLAHLDAVGLSKYDMPEYFLDARPDPADAERQDPQARHRRLDRAGPRGPPTPVRAQSGDQAGKTARG